MPSSWRGLGVKSFLGQVEGSPASSRHKVIFSTEQRVSGIPPLGTIPAARGSSVRNRVSAGDQAPSQIKISPFSPESDTFGHLETQGSAGLDSADKNLTFLDRGSSGFLDQDQPT
eukprot:5461180-Pyramimonas_sp.AAC.1